MSDLSRTTASVGAIRPKRFFDSVKLWNGGEGLFEKSSLPAPLLKNFHTEKDLHGFGSHSCGFIRKILLLFGAHSYII